MVLLGAFIVEAILSGLAFWKPNAVLFMIIAGISLMLGLAWFDTYNTNLSLSIGFMLMVYSFASVAYAFRVILWNTK